MSNQMGKDSRYKVLVDKSFVDIDLEKQLAFCEGMGGVGCQHNLPREHDDEIKRLCMNVAHAIRELDSFMRAGLEDE